MPRENDEEEIDWKEGTENPDQENVILGDEDEEDDESED